MDLFAGSGALGIEALSRRAREVVFVDKSRQSIIAVKKNLLKLNLEAKLIRADALLFIETYKGEPYDLIFIDPPYNKYNPHTIFTAIEEANFLNEGGHLIFELQAGAAEPIANTLLPASLRTLSDTSVGIWFKGG